MRSACCTIQLLYRGKMPTSSDVANIQSLQTPPGTVLAEARAKFVQTQKHFKITRAAVAARQETHMPSSLKNPWQMLLHSTTFLSPHRPCDVQQGQPLWDCCCSGHATARSSSPPNNQQKQVSQTSMKTPPPRSCQQGEYGMYTQQTQVIYYMAGRCLERNSLHVSSVQTHGQNNGPASATGARPSNLGCKKPNMPTSTLALVDTDINRGASAWAFLLQGVGANHVLWWHDILNCVQHGFITGLGGLAARQVA